MLQPEHSDVTVLVNGLMEGNPDAQRELMPVIYQELHRLANSHLRREREGHTLQTTALVNEAYLKLVNQQEQWHSRAHFFALASQMMRRVLVDYARQRNRLKRAAGGHLNNRKISPSPTRNQLKSWSLMRHWRGWKSWNQGRFVWLSYAILPALPWRRWRSFSRCHRKR